MVLKDFFPFFPSKNIMLVHNTSCLKHFFLTPSKRHPSAYSCMVKHCTTLVQNEKRHLLPQIYGLIFQLLSRWPAGWRTCGLTGDVKSPELVQSNKLGRKIWRAMVAIRGVNIRKKNPLSNPAAGIPTASKPLVLPQGNGLSPAPQGSPGSRARALPPEGAPLWTESLHTPAHTAHPTHWGLLFRSFFHQKASKATSPTFPVSVEYQTWPWNASPCSWGGIPTP